MQVLKFMMISRKTWPSGDGANSLIYCLLQNHWPDLKNVFQRFIKSVGDPDHGLFCLLTNNAPALKIAEINTINF